MTDTLYSQIKGIINDLNDERLAYATIYIEGTSIGTISNAEGEYELELVEQKQYDITFQYVGYKRQTVTISYEGTPIFKNITLKNDDNIIHELVITADREDPSYAIIRKAIKKRNYYKTLIKSYGADLYVKGVVKITSAPKEILGEKIGNLGGILDTSRQGIVYLSESKSKFYYKSPDKTKEIMLSSVKSGDNSLFTANQFSWASFDLYSEYLNFSRSIVSPIADNALSHYKYMLEGVTFDNNGYMVNKIKVIPKSNTSPLLNGYIYITDDLWNIYSTDLSIYGAALKNTFLDTIKVKQVYVPVNKPDTWTLFSQVFSFNAGLLGFKMAGNFSYIFSKYDMKADVEKYFETNETFRVDQDALKKDSAFWNAVRPIPLTAEEARDYIKKDSLQRLWHTRAYMDSLDKLNNRFTVFKFLTGYTYNKTFKNISLTYPSPLSTLRFNAVEGFKISLGVRWEKTDSIYREWSVTPVFEYGFSDKIVKPRIAAEYRFDNYNQGFLSFAAGRQYQQYEPRQPITERNNTWASLWDKVNGIRLFQHDFVTLGFRQEVINGLYINLSSSLSHRKHLYINSQYSLRHKSLNYAENIPRNDLDFRVYDENTYFKNKLNILIRPAQKYSSYPNVKRRNASDWPNIEIEYESGIPMDVSSALFNKLTLRVRDKYVNANLLGYYSYNIEGGTALGNRPSFFGDFFHPMGNELRTPIDPDLSSFNLLPYYLYSNDKYYMQVNFRHHFNGFITDKIPLLNKTSLKLVSGFSFLYEPYKKEYLELFTGLENFRIGPFHLFDLEYTWSFDHHGFKDYGINIRLSQLLNN
jgi:hypothetical protein